MKRPVLVWIEDDRADTLFVDLIGEADPHDDARCVLSEVIVNVPPDDQLARDVYLMVTALDRNGTYQGLREACKRVSAAFRLDEGSE